MNKPKITFIPYECFRVISADGYWLDDMQKMEAYEEMIDALIESHKDLVEWNDCIPSSNETEDIIEQIEQALKKAGVQI